MGQNNVVLSVVEMLPNHKVEFFLQRLDQPDFWARHSPIKETKISMKEKGHYTFRIADQVVIEPVTQLKEEFDLSGDLYVTHKGIDGSKGHLFELKATLNEYESLVEARIRAKDTSKGIKVGIFVHTYEIEPNALLDIGRDAVLFAARQLLREGIQLFANSK